MDCDTRAAASSEAWERRVAAGLALGIATIVLVSSIVFPRPMDARAEVERAREREVASAEAAMGRDARREAALARLERTASGPLDLSTRERRIALARRHAPESRFNAWFPDPTPTPSHRTEDFLPADVDRFLARCASGEVEVVSERSLGPQPARTERVRTRGALLPERDRLRGVPARMTGDPPGLATTYVSVYADPEEPLLACMEFWWFHPFDVSDARLGGGVVRGVGGHRGDWEHILVRVEAAARGSLGDGLPPTRIVDAVYFGHQHALHTLASELELVDGAHPAVYVSQGKHASFPAAGEWRDYAGRAPLAAIDDAFHGNGVRLRAWEAGLVDITRPDPGPERGSASPGSGAGGADGPIAASAVPAWLSWTCQWGADGHRVAGIDLGHSAYGPWHHAEAGRGLAGARGAFFRRFRDALGLCRGLRLDRDRGFTAPRPGEVPSRPIPAWDAP